MNRRTEQLPLSEDLIRDFIQENKKQWSQIKHNDQYIFINFSMIRMQMGWVIPKLLYAKGVESVIGAKPVVFTWRENLLLTELIESFGIRHIALDTLNRSDIKAFLKSFIKTMGLVLFNPSGEGFKKMETCGLKAGKSLYEDIIRTSSLSTIKSVQNKICIKKIMHLLWTVYSLDHLSKKCKPCFVVCDDIAYHEGLFLNIFHKYGALVYNTSSIGEGRIVFDEDGNIKRRSRITGEKCRQYIDKIGEEAVLWSERFLKERYEGKNGRNIDRGAFSGKKVYTKQELLKEYGLDPAKKVVVIMAHTFTDAVFNCGELYFRDYYDWTEYTLKLAEEIKSVNWILKPHPTRKAYNESEDSIEKMYERHKKPHVFLLSDDVSAESIRNIADVLVTIGGNAGAEFACEGIPSIISGKPYYSGFGYTIEPKTREEYEKSLKQVSMIERLNSEQVITAKKVFYLANSKFRSHKYSDEFSNIVNSNYNKMLNEIAIQYFTSNEGTQKYNDQIMQKIKNYFENHDIKECEYYQRGAMRGKEYTKKG